MPGLRFLRASTPGGTAFLLHACPPSERRKKKRRKRQALAADWSR